MILFGGALAQQRQDFDLPRGQGAVVSCIGDAAALRHGILVQHERRNMQSAIQHLPDGGEQHMLAGGFGDIAQRSTAN
jgi:hypothetical protein